MLLIRRLLQIVFGLLVLAVLFTLNSPRADFVADAVMIGLFVLIILVLGPWWPSADWMQNHKLDLPTDNPKVALPMFWAVMGAFSFYYAWSAHTQPAPHFYRFEVIVARLFGAEGVALAWLFVGIGCFVGAWRAFGRNRTTPNNVH